MNHQIKRDRSPARYRSLVRNNDLVSRRVREKETDLFISASRDFSIMVRRHLRKFRRQLEAYLEQYPSFRTSLLPVWVGEGAPPIAGEMARAAGLCGVGPMAAVAGALAYFIGQELALRSPEFIIENGGDVYINTLRERTVAIYAGETNPFSGRLGILVKSGQTPLGIATSSKTVGHSLSWGRTDAAVVLAENPALADAAATALGNRVYSPDRSIWAKAVSFLGAIEGIKGGVIVIGDQMQAWGEIELVKLKK